MKLIFKNILLLLVLVYLGSCQEEVMEIKVPPAGQVFTADSPVASLAKRIALKDGSEDNIISGASCLSIDLPVTVVVNGHELIITSEKDYDEVERILDQYDDDEDYVQVVFPVTIIFSDYTEVMINNEDELEDYIEECIEGGFDEDIECVDFKYPLNFSLYDAQNQITNTVTVSNDKELYFFLDELEDEVYVNIEFPVTLILADGSETKAYVNEELEDIIEGLADDCDEDDDNDFDDDDVDTSGFNSILLEGEWRITYFFDGSDRTQLFSGWTFEFNEDNTLTATDGTDSFSGSWESYGENGILELELDSDSDSEDHEMAISREWQVLEYNEDRIKVENVGDGDPVILILEK